MPKKLRALKLSVLTLLVSGVLGFFLLEVIVRFSLPNYSPEIAKRHAIPYVSRVYSPTAMESVDRLINVNSANAWGRLTAEDSSERLIFISANGYRGPAFDVRKPPETYRIIVIGGSSVFDQNVYDAPDSYLNSWPHQIQLILNNQGFEHVEVINAGVPGQTSADSLGRVFSQLWTYAPDMLVVYQGWNDFKYWHRRPITPETPLLDRVRPFDAQDNPFLNYQGNLDSLLSYSQVYVRLRTLYYRWRWRPSHEGSVPKDITIASDYGVHGPLQYNLNLTLIAQAAKTIGAIPVIVKQATLVSADNTQADRERIGYHYMSLEHDAIVKAFEESYQIIDRVGVESAALVIDPTKKMNGKRDWFTDAIHTTDEGSSELARFIAERLVAEGVRFTPKPVERTN